ncbi:MAG: GGDEF domain-containing protein [Clostridia bacterium]|nr:GGDEF domain-containing protein [Clostridia bacterium]
MLKKLKDLLLYAGLDDAKMKSLLPEAQEDNARYLFIYAGMTTFLFSVCLLVSLAAGGHLTVNRLIYTIMITISVMLCVMTKTLVPKHPSLSTIFAVTFIIAMYGYSFAVSLLHAEMPGVSAVAILLVMPTLFNYRPIYMIILTIAAQVVYLLLSLMTKERALAMLDLWNCLFFGSIAVVLSIYQMKVKFRLFQQKRETKYLSETDLLTGAKNRNCFEKNAGRYQDTCKENLYCVYVDVNGLHELNNTFGHDAGDAMLQTVASVVIKAYGQTNTYRIGGDEFIAFTMDEGLDTVRNGIRSIIKEIENAGYSVSIGSACQNKDALEIPKLVKDAEGFMYNEKREYYANVTHDRRNRNLVTE